MKVLLFTVVLVSACATANTLPDTALPRLGQGLQASEELYRAACEPRPLPGLEKTCPAAKIGINDVVDVYTEINSAMKAVQ